MLLPRHTRDRTDPHPKSDWTQQKTRRPGITARALLLALILVGGLGCNSFKPPEPGYPKPPNITTQVLGYSNCINEAISTQYDNVYSRQDRERYVIATCRLMEPKEALSPIPNCRDQYFNWFQSHHQKTDNVILRLFATTVCAPPPRGETP